MIWVIRWYPDKGCDLFRDEFADYANEEIMQRLMMRAYARNADVAFTGTRGITKTSTKFKYAMLNGLVWPGTQSAYYGPSYKQMALIGSKQFKQIAHDYYRNSAVIGGIGRPKWDVVSKISGIPEHSELKSVRYGSFRGGIFAEVPFSCIERMEHIRMDGARGEYLTSAAVRAKWNGRAPDIVINAELFNYSNYTPASGVVHHGELEYRGWQPFIGFSNYRTPIQEGYNAVSSPDAVGGYPALVLGGEKSFTVPKGLEGNRYRTAMGLKGDVLGILVTQNPVNLEVVANKFVSDGYDFAINLDGGSSSGYAIPSKAWARANKLRGFVGIWLKGGNGNYLSRSAAPVKPSKPAKTESWAETDKSAAKGVRMKVTASALNLRAGAGTSTAVKTVLKFGEVVTWYGYQTENWYYVRTAGGKEGYVSKQYVKRA